MDMAGGRTKDTDTPAGFWLWRDMIDFDGEGRSFASSEQTLVDSWCYMAGICDSGGDDRRHHGGGGWEVAQDGWTEMVKGLEWVDGRDDEDNEAPRYEKKPPRYEDIDSYRPISLPTPASRGTKRNIRPRLNLRGGAGSKRLGDDERVPKVIWFLAGGVGRAPTGKGLREWKEKARKKGEGGRKERGRFWGRLGLGVMRKGKKRMQKTEEETKGNAEDAPDGAQAAGGEAARGDAQGDVGDVAPGGSGGEAGAAPGAGKRAQAGERNAQGDAASNSSGRGSGSGSSGSGSGSGDSGRAE